MGAKAIMRVLAFAMALAAAGCTSVPQPVENPRLIWCEQNEPRRDATDQTPRWELDEINVHNAKGAAWCNWRP